jgi:hypothetical protein
VPISVGFLSIVHTGNFKAVTEGLQASDTQALNQTTVHLQAGARHETIQHGNIDWRIAPTARAKSNQDNK